jgi:glycosyltransferase 2 family protein
MMVVDPMETRAKRRKMPGWLPQTLGYGASVACVVWILHRYSIREDLLPAIHDLDWRWMSVSLAAHFAILVTQAWRWNVLLAPVVEANLGRTTQSIYIGQLFSQVLPLRTGELIRCYLLAHWNDLRISLAFASAAVERLIDGFLMLAAFLATAAFVRTMPEDVILGVEILTGLLVAGACILGWVVLHKQHAHSVIRENRWAATMRHLIEGLHLMGNARTLAWTTLLSAGYLAVQVFAVWALMKADQMDLSFWQAGGVLAVIRLVIVAPSGPGNLGLLQVGCVLALGLFDVERNDAKTFSMFLAAAEAIPGLLGGAVAIALTGLNFSELRERARHGMRAPTHRQR